MELGEVEKRDAENARIARNEYDVRIARYAADFGISLEDATRWDMDAEYGEMFSFQDVEHYFWSQGLSWSEIDRRTAEWKRKITV